MIASFHRFGLNSCAHGFSIILQEPNLVLTSIEYIFAVFGFNNKQMASVDPATATGDDRGIGGAGELMPQTGTSINPEQLGLKILYPPEGSPEAGKVEVE